MKVLLITPNFFDYPKQICNEIRSMGHEVDWFDDRPSTNSLIKAVVRLKKEFIGYWIQKYFDSILLYVKEKKYEKVILISGQSLSFSVEMIAKLKQNQNQAEFILYQWDSVENFPYIQNMYKFFDRCYSFDTKDVENNPNLKFLPLFYTRKYEAIGAKKIKKFKYDCMFVGTAHPKKYRYIKEMSKQLSNVYKRQFIYFYFPSRLVYFYRKFFNPEFRKSKYSEFHFESIKTEKINELLTQSKCVLDSAQQGQTGLTIRVLETLGAKRKIITTNSEVKNYDFYCEENIYIYTGTFDFSSPFFTKEYKEIDKKIYLKYSLRKWIMELLK